MCDKNSSAKKKEMEKREKKIKMQQRAAVCKVEMLLYE